MPPVSDPHERSLNYLAIGMIFFICVCILGVIALMQTRSRTLGSGAVGALPTNMHPTLDVISYDPMSPGSSASAPQTPSPQKISSGLSDTDKVAWIRTASRALELYTDFGARDYPASLSTLVESGELGRSAIDPSITYISKGEFYSICTLLMTDSYACISSDLGADNVFRFPKKAVEPAYQDWTAVVWLGTRPSEKMSIPYPSSWKQSADKYTIDLVARTDGGKEIILGKINASTFILDKSFEEFKKFAVLSHGPQLEISTTTDTTLKEAPGFVIVGTRTNESQLYFSYIFYFHRSDHVPVLSVYFDRTLSGQFGMVVAQMISAMQATR